MNSVPFVYTTDGGYAAVLTENFEKAQRLLQLFPPATLSHKWYLNNVEEIAHRQERLVRASEKQDAAAITEFRQRLNEVLLGAAGELARITSMKREVKEVLHELSSAVKRLQLLIVRMTPARTPDHNRVLMYNVCAATPVIGQLNNLLQILNDAEESFHAHAGADGLASIDRALQQAYVDCIKELHD